MVSCSSGLAPALTLGVRWVLLSQAGRRWLQVGQGLYLSDCPLSTMCSRQLGEQGAETRRERGLGRVSVPSEWTGPRAGPGSFHPRAPPSVPPRTQPQTRCLPHPDTAGVYETPAEGSLCHHVIIAIFQGPGVSQQVSLGGSLWHCLLSQKSSFMFSANRSAPGYGGQWGGGAPLPGAAASFRRCLCPVPTCSFSMGMSAQGSLVNTRPSKADVIPQRQRQPRPVSTKWEKIGSHEIRPSIFLSVFLSCATCCDQRRPPHSLIHSQPSPAHEPGNQ